MVEGRALQRIAQHFHRARDACRAGNSSSLDRMHWPAAKRCEHCSMPSVSAEDRALNVAAVVHRSLEERIAVETTSSKDEDTAKLHCVTS